MPETPPPHQTEESVMTLVELQKFLADELASADPADGFERAFLPLTDGLGLESPIRKVEVKAPAYVPSARAPRPESPETEALTKFLEDPGPPESAPEPLLAPSPEAPTEEAEPPHAPLPEPPIAREEIREEDRIPIPAVAPDPRPLGPEDTAALPPPVPNPGFFRRFFAGVMDEAFVFCLLGLALIITSKCLSRSSTPLLLQLVSDFSRPLFQRFVALEFATLWLAYFAIGIGVLDMTFGMWVWGMRVSYGPSSVDSGFFRKMLRVFWSFFFFAPIFPSFLLVLRFRGRNLLDWLSGTSLYRSGV